MPLTYTVPPKSEVKKLNENKVPDATDEPDKTLDEKVFESKVSYLSTIRTKNSTSYREISADLLKQNATHMATLHEELLVSASGLVPALLFQTAECGCALAGQ